MTDQLSYFQKMPNRKKIGCVVVVVILFNSCTLYYTTADIDRSLKSSLNEVNSNCNTITKDFNTIRLEYTEMNCRNDKDPYLTAEQLFSNFQTDLDELMGLKNELNQEYTEFLGYTKGKDKVSTGSEEWQKLKSTKKKFKDGLKEIQSRGNGLTKKGNEFAKYTNEQLVPIVKYCEVTDYIKKCRNSVVSIEKSRQKVTTSLNENVKKGKPVLAKFKGTHPDQCEKATLEFKKIRDELKLLEEIKEGCNNVVDEFEQQTKGMAKIYSCSDDWKLVEQTNNKLSSLQLELKDIENHIREGINNINMIIQELSGP